MRKLTMLAFLLLIFILSGCNGAFTKSDPGTETLSGDKPPHMSIEINGKIHELMLGSYCWGTESKGVVECVETAGSMELLTDEEPIQVKAGEKISLIIDYTPKPNKIHLFQLNHTGEKEIKANNFQFTAPTEKGIYFYDYGLWWMDEVEESLSHGSASYAFVLEVK